MGAPGAAKTGGRKAGTPNKRTAEVIEKLEALGCDPIQGMARIAMDETNAPELRGRMYAELAQYVYPKRRAMDLKTDRQDDDLIARLLEGRRRLGRAPSLTRRLEMEVTTPDGSDLVRGWA